MKKLFILFIFPAVLTAASFSDDFDSYTPGDDLSDSIYWLKLDPGGSLTVADDGGNGIVETVWNGNSYLGYVCAGSLICSDAEVRAKVMLNGSEGLAGLISRVDPITGACYIGGLYRVYGTIGATMILYINSSGDFSILSNDYFYPLHEDTWYDVAFEVTGSDPVSLKLSVDGTLNSGVLDTEYNIDSGMTGIGGNYQSSPPLFGIDDFTVTDFSSSMEANSFGAIKASFR